MLKKLITFTPRMSEMIDEIQRVKGYVSFSAVIHAAVVDLHSRTFPAYKGVSSREEDPMTKVRRKAAEKEAKKDLVREEKVSIVEELGGEVIEEHGVEYCTYYTYSGRKRFAQRVPLLLVNAELIKAQYQPNKERILKLQQEKKVDY